ncbi:MAG: hypothetical protein PHX21_11455 [bacterium]|nr:hypothetical protein [bacterium]
MGYYINLPDSAKISWETIKLIIESQASHAEHAINFLSTFIAIAITVIIAFTGLLLYFSWFKNKKEVAELMTSCTDKINKMIKEKSKELETLLEQFKQIEKNLKTEINEITKKSDKSLEEFKQNVDEKLTEFDAEKSRLFALSAISRKDWKTSASWWVDAIIGYSKTKNGKGVRVSTNALIDALEQCEYCSAEDKKQISTCISSIPPILSEEKEKIKKRLKDLPEQKPTPSATAK